MSATLRRLYCAAALALLGVAPSAASAQVADWTQGWSGQATIYAWLPVINGSQEGPEGQPIVDLYTSDVLSALDMAFMGTAASRRTSSASCSTPSTPSSPPTANGSSRRVKTDHDQARLLHRGGLLPGLRRRPQGLHRRLRRCALLRHQRRIQDRHRGNLGADSFSKSLSWTDAIVGLRAGVNLNQHWSLHGFADVGGFDGSKDTSWELYGGANYAFNDHWEGTLGYRYVSIQKAVTDRAALDISIQGPLFGVTYKF